MTDNELVGAMRETFAESGIDWQQRVHYPALHELARCIGRRSLLGVCR
jgi:hypothetical protein